MHAHEIVYERFLAQYLAPPAEFTAIVEADPESCLEERHRLPESAVCQWSTGSVISPLASEVTPISLSSVSSLPLFTQGTSGTKSHDPGSFVPAIIKPCAAALPVLQVLAMRIVRCVTAVCALWGHDVRVCACRRGCRAEHTTRPVDTVDVLATSRNRWLCLSRCVRLV
jgi:hypothetical protein